MPEELDNAKLAEEAAEVIEDALRYASNDCAVLNIVHVAIAVIIGTYAPVFAELARLRERIRVLEDALGPFIPNPLQDVLIKNQEDHEPWYWNTLVGDHRKAAETMEGKS